MNTDLQNDIQLLNEILDADDNGIDHDKSHEDVFPRIYKTHIYEIDGNRQKGTVECGSVRVDSTKGLYRLLYLCQPKQVDFSDMYKSSSLFAITSPDHEFVGDVQFYKYQLAICFSATADHVKGRESNIVSGIPGYNNGVRAADPLLRSWCDTLKRCLDREWMVYGGNDFRV